LVTYEKRTNRLLKEVIVISDYKVIFHIDELSKWNLLLKNVSNLLNAIADDAFSVEVLANAEAVKYYDTNADLDADVKTMEALNRKGVNFFACNNALMANNIEKSNIIHFVDTVPAGILELVIKQGEGYAYIKP
jgi:intracellular sulfur oxidation DsrE/DsrF family protein